jgi:hypothetical protein
VGKAWLLLFVIVATFVIVMAAVAAVASLVARLL